MRGDDLPERAGGHRPHHLAPRHRPRGHREGRQEGPHLPRRDGEDPRQLLLGRQRPARRDLHGARRTRRPPAPLTGGNLDEAKKAQRTLIEAGMRGKATSAGDSVVEFELPSNAKFLVGKGDSDDGAARRLRQPGPPHQRHHRRQDPHPARARGAAALPAGSAAAPSAAWCWCCSSSRWCAAAAGAGAARCRACAPVSGMPPAFGGAAACRRRWRRRAVEAARRSPRRCLGRRRRAGASAERPRAPDSGRHRGRGGRLHRRPPASRCGSAGTARRARSCSRSPASRAPTPSSSSRAGQLLVRDESSNNGTYLNGQRIPAGAVDPNRSRRRSPLRPRRVCRPFGVGSSSGP